MALFTSYVVSDDFSEITNRIELSIFRADSLPVVPSTKTNRQMLKSVIRLPSLASRYHQGSTISRRSFSHSSQLLTSKVLLTLYAKDGCSLCDKAKVVCEEVRSSKDLKNPISFQYVDITEPLNKDFWEAYCFDVPVLHLDRRSDPETVKFMHYLDTGKIVEEINK